MSNDMSILELNGYAFPIADSYAREQIAKDPVKLIESNDTSNPLVLRNIESGTWVLKGRFIPFAGSTGSFSFSSGMLVNVSKSSKKSNFLIFYTTYVQMIEITDTGFTRKNVYLDQLQARPRKKEITLLSSGWAGTGTTYSQTVTVSGITANSKIDLQPSPEQLRELLIAEISLVVANENGTVTVFAIGAAPTSDYTMQIIVTEVDVE